MDPYATLNVPPDASREQIRSAFARIARSTHPDKVGASNSRSAAEAYGEVDEAWKILSDDQMRAAFDEFGEDGTRALTTLRTQKQGDSVRRVSRYEMRKAVKLMREGEEEDYIGAETTIRCHSTLQDWLGLFRGRSKSADPDKPLFSHIFVQHALGTSSVDNKHHFGLSAIAGSARMKRDRSNPRGFVLSPPMGAVTATYRTTRHLNEFDMSLTTSALPGVPSQFQFGCGRMITSLLMGKIVLLADRNEAQLNFDLKRTLSPTLLGELTLHLADEKGFLSAGFKGVSPVGDPDTKQNRVWTISMLFPGSAPDIGLSASWTEPLSTKIGIKAQLNVSLSQGPTVEFEKTRKVDDRTRIGGRVSWSLANGIFFRLKLARGHTRFDFPIMITKQFSIATALTSALVPYAIEKVVTRALRPWSHQWRKQRRDELRQKSLEARNRARNQIALMQPSAEANREAQQKEDGLVIVQARYGRRLDEEYSWSDPELRPNIDVSIPLNFLVTKRGDTPMLDLNETSKVNLLGFYDPSICSVSRSEVWSREEFEDEEDGDNEFDGEPNASARKNRLFVRYSYRGFMYEKVFKDEEAVHLPHPDAVRVI